ncbi:phosphotransferase [Pseudooceanicola nanhaiensis]|uniref:phosphotransferase n=1 Tax=Pseudooceanicola nanhaiensis TaxID=375761 RepID=UPI001CD5AEFD|nr:phosphotransferase [Pseudooceanicola nanhaiensis]MCA0918781.1 phosphotransferase [Pseudooceanicola nanhaiensis]
MAQVKTDPDLIPGGSQFVAAPPRLEESDAAAIAEHHFGLTGQCSLLTSERDQNFRLSCADGSSYVLKITNPAEAEEITRAQVATLEHIARRDPGLPVPRTVPTRDGEFAASIKLPGGGVTRARIMTYLPGQQLRHAVQSRALRCNIARMAARLDRALSDLPHPGVAQDILWDISETHRVRPLLSRIAGDERRALAGVFLDRFCDHVLPQLHGLRRQFIHNDLNPYNIVVDPTRPEHPSGFLDFGDMVEAPLINELAVAAAYEDYAQPDWAETLAAVISAYHEITPLTEAELALLPDLIAARQVLTVSITEWRAARYPENRDYILRNNAGAWTSLAALRGMADGQLRDMVLTAVEARA